MPTDCSGKPYPLFLQASVVCCEQVEGTNPKGSVWRLVVEPVWGEHADKKQLPLAGHFIIFDIIVLIITKIYKVR